MNVLIVDDDPLCLEILTDYLTAEGWKVLQAPEGMKALKILKQNPEIDLFLIDRMMPLMDGMELLSHIKKDPRFANVPVIMETAASAVHQIIEGIKQGVYYYLTKPFEKELLLSVVSSAVRSASDYKLILSDHLNLLHGMALVVEGTFEFKNLEEGRQICLLTSRFFNKDHFFYRGLWELMVNAIEHGNLGIDCDEKNNLIVSGRWEKEIGARLKSENYGSKRAQLNFKRKGKTYFFEIRDQGKGFDWKEIDKKLENHYFVSNGRGIMIARKVLKNFTYRGSGNIATFEMDLIDPL